MKFLVVDDHKLFSDGLSTLLDELYPGVVIDTESTAEMALQRLDADSEYDLALIDLRLPDTDGLELLRNLSKRGVTTPTAVLSASNDYEEIYAALKAGALGFIHKSVDRDELRHAIETVLRGEKYLSDLSAATDQSNAVSGAGEVLTRRQREVLELLSEGLLNKQIAQKLGTSEHTVKIHVSAIMKKLGARTRTACVNQAMRMGMLAKN